MVKHGGQVLLLRWRVPRKIKTIVWEGQWQGRKDKAAVPCAAGRLWFNLSRDLLETNP